MFSFSRSFFIINVFIPFLFLSHNHLADVKFVCVPDKFNPGFMCPIDKKITKFLIEGRKRTRNRIPIFELDDKGMEASLL